ncbi:GNAT family N-acetyltransferase [Lactobacillus paragasseri]|jgi:ribosomal protein S18 acetylase RimI-like enzyme|uniref:Acetyltransferase, GNAT family n=2 Tax=Lactobacillus paragasseri TaxID=2107999 RepID=A0AA87A1T7_9LACO|nr:GNAT family N-acetyltransferase [Lactobacillus paragasseri]EFJ68933.1 acetyltransferase, GNAT family [Lactobacillus paragasseri JV-V03]MDK7068488.1 GNAT family N-acetyltransferase [Lactobacillus paragasseri]MDK7953397.1 GNAT family N-acetyltransferase [Lactobacillus paragasseri]MDO6362268.1 GNAT family N-acetyltransferase [Lactobacillus paragasseri]MDX5060603.1 GNAT family N-acetyltransferase [Lactobacillus paragasseri]
MVEKGSTRMMQAYEIKKVTIADIQDLQQISRETFSETFGSQNSSENMEKFLNKAYAEEKLRSEIENKNSNFYFLIVNNQVAGYLKVNEGDAQTERVADNALEVERIYLKQNFQHQGLGLVLIKLAEELARKKNKANMWLGVWEKNYQAQAFYKKDGFKRVSQHTFVVGDDPQTDFILVKELK